MKLLLIGVCIGGCSLGSTAGIAQASAFSQGFADRAQLQEWFGNQTGDTKSGIAYWTGQRSLARPGACRQDGRSVAWVEGCGEPMFRRTLER